MCLLAVCQPLLHFYMLDTCIYIVLELMLHIYT